MMDRERALGSIDVDVAELSAWFAGSAELAFAKVCEQV